MTQYNTVFALFIQYLKEAVIQVNQPALVSSDDNCAWSTDNDYDAGACACVHDVAVAGSTSIANPSSVNANYILSHSFSFQLICKKIHYREHCQ